MCKYLKRLKVRGARQKSGELKPAERYIVHGSGVEHLLAEYYIRADKHQHINDNEMFDYALKRNSREEHKVI